MKNLKAVIRKMEYEEDVSNVVDLARRYVEDTEYYLERGDCETALVTASYAEGLLDALRMLGKARFEWVREKRPKVLIGGTFEILHPGHLEFMKFASKFGDLYVIVSRDENAEKFKGRKIIIPQDQRLEVVRSIKYVKDAILGEKDIIEGVKKVSPDIVVLGPDQDGKLEEKLKEMGIKVIRMEKRKCKKGFICSTTEIINRLLDVFCPHNHSQSLINT